MTKYQKLLFEIYGEYLESFGFKPTKDAWYKVSSHGIACFVGTRLLGGGDMMFYINCQPVISRISNHTKSGGHSDTPIDFGSKSITQYLLDGEDAFKYYPMISRKQLVNNDEYRNDFSQRLQKVMEANFASFFRTDMTLKDCRSFQDDFEALFLLKYGKRDSIVPRYNITLVDINLLMHDRYDMCLDYYLTRIRSPLSSEILDQFVIPSVSQDKTALLQDIYSILCESIDREPMEYIEQIINTGMQLKPDFDEHSFCDCFYEITGQYSEIIGAIKNDDYDHILQILEEQHNLNASVYNEMKIDVPAFSCYFNS